MTGSPQTRSYLEPVQPADPALFAARKKTVLFYMGTNDVNRYDLLREAVRHNTAGAEIAESKVEWFVDRAVDHFINDRCMTQEGYVEVVGGTIPGTETRGLFGMFRASEGAEGWSGERIMKTIQKDYLDPMLAETRQLQDETARKLEDRPPGSGSPGSGRTER